jgi:uncharacterized delta-60 repeat protein
MGRSEGQWLGIALLFASACGDDGGSPGAPGDGGTADDGGARTGDSGESGDGDAESGAAAEPTAVLAPAGLVDPEGVLVGAGGALRLLPQAIAAQGDKLIIGGQCAGDMCAVRVFTDGRLDETFGVAGLLRVPDSMPAPANPLFALNQDGANAVWVASDALYLAGFALAPNAVTAHAFAVAKASPDGVLDATFGASGVSVVDANASSTSNAARFSALAFDDTGRLYGIGEIDQSTDMDIVVARFLADGRLDGSYPGGGTAGVFLSHPASERGLFGVRSGDGFVVGGDAVIARVGASGSLDTAFGSAGFVQVDPGLANALVARSDGKLLLAGFDDDDSGNRARLSLTQLEADGTPDLAFGTNGVVSHDYDLTQIVFENGETLSGGFGIVRGAQLLPDGGLLIYASMLGVLNNYPTLLRVDAAGQPLETFGTQGLSVARASLPLLDDISGLAPPSRLLVVGGRYYAVDWRVGDGGGYLSLWSGDL